MCVCRLYNERTAISHRRQRLCSLWGLYLQQLDAPYFLVENAVWNAADDVLDQMDAAGMIVKASEQWFKQTTRLKNTSQARELAKKHIAGEIAKLQTRLAQMDTRLASAHQDAEQASGHAGVRGLLGNPPDVLEATTPSQHSVHSKTVLVWLVRGNSAPRYGYVGTKGQFDLVRYMDLFDSRVVRARVDVASICEQQNHVARCFLKCS